MSRTRNTSGASFPAGRLSEKRPPRSRTTSFSSMVASGRFLRLLIAPVPTKFNGPNPFDKLARHCEVLVAVHRRRFDMRVFMVLVERRYNDEVRRLRKRLCKRHH